MQNDQRNCRNVFKRVLVKDSLKKTMKNMIFHDFLPVWGLALGSFRFPVCILGRSDLRRVTTQAGFEPDPQPGW